MIRRRMPLMGFWALCLCLLVSRSAIAQTFTISTVAGNGKAGFSGDGGPAVQAELRNPAGVAVGADGALYIADRKNMRIRKVDPRGAISTIAGDGAPFDPSKVPQDGSALSARLGGPYGVAVDANGNVYIADQTGCCVHKFTPDGRIARVAGTGQRGYSGDGIAAVDAQLAGPNAVAFDASSNAYIADTGNNRIRIVDGNGTIRTFAGGATAGYAGDGQPAKLAQLKAPAALCLDAQGAVYICDFGNHVVRKVSTDGVISTIAGTGKFGFSGDGGPATAARINQPCGVAVDKQGQVYIADSANCRIRVVRLDGTIETVAGTGRMAYRGDGGPATEAAINIPDLIDLDADGNLYIAEYRNHVIRKLSPLRVVGE